jgi:hypothetical protein
MSICNLSADEARKLEQDGTMPNCRHHRHLSTQKAMEGVKQKIFAWVGEKGRRVTPTRVWKTVRSGPGTVMQLVDRC